MSCLSFVALCPVLWMQSLCFSSDPPPLSSGWTLYLYRLHLVGKVQGLGYIQQNEGAPLMSWVQGLGWTLRWGLSEKRDFVCALGRRASWRQKKKSLLLSNGHSRIMVAKLQRRMSLKCMGFKPWAQNLKPFLTKSSKLSSNEIVTWDARIETKHKNKYLYCAHKTLKIFRNGNQIEENTKCVQNRKKVKKSPKKGHILSKNSKYKNCHNN